MKKIIFVLEYMLLFLITLQFGTVYSIFEGYTRFITYIPILLLMLLLFVNRKFIKPIHVIPVAIYLLGAIFPFFTSPSKGQFTLCYLLFLPAMWLLLNALRCKGDKYVRSFLLKYSDIIVVLAIVSLIMWWLCSILQFVPPTGVMPYEWGKDEGFIPAYYGIYFETQEFHIGGFSIFRNTGIFYEGPFHNMILCCALLIEYYCRCKPSKFRITILVVAIVTTFTTTGMFFLLIFGSYYLLRKVSNAGCLVFTLFPMILTFSYIGGNYLLELKKETGEGSYNTRMETIIVDIETGLANPVFGVGLVGGEFKGVNKFHADQSNSLFYLFAQGGTYALILYVGTLLYIPFLYYKRTGDIRRMFIMLLFFIVFTVTLSLYTYLVLMFMAWGLSDMNKNKSRVVK